jgi:hypothetical protein
MKIIIEDSTPELSKFILETTNQYELTYDKKSGYLYRNWYCKNNAFGNHLNQFTIYRKLIEAWKLLIHNKNVSYVIWHSTLMETYREKGYPLPYHTDIDLKINYDDIFKLEMGWVTKWVYAYIHPEFEKPRKQRKRYACDGKNIRARTPCSIDFEIRLCYDKRKCRPFPCSCIHLDGALYKIIENNFCYGSELAWSHPISDIYPLNMGLYLGLKVFIPNNPTAVLSNQYGNNFMKAHKVCDKKTKKWKSQIKKIKQDTSKTPQKWV